MRRQLRKWFAQVLVIALLTGLCGAAYPVSAAQSGADIKTETAEESKEAVLTEAAADNESALKAESAAETGGVLESESSEEAASVTEPESSEEAASVTEPESSEEATSDTEPKSSKEAASATEPESSKEAASVPEPESSTEESHGAKEGEAAAPESSAPDADGDAEDAGSEGIYEEKAPIILKEVRLTYDPGVLDLNTAWTEREIQERLRDNGASVITEGCLIDYNNTWLMKAVGDGIFWGIGDGTGHADADTSYVLQFCLRLKSGYDWTDDLTEYAPGVPEHATAALLSLSFKIFVNGMQRNYSSYISYNESENRLWITVPIGKPSTLPRVTGVRILGANSSVQSGEFTSFQAEVTGTTANKAVNWTVLGANSEITNIDAEGTLYVDSAETAKTLRLRASAVADGKIYDEILLQVVKTKPTIDSVAISPAAPSVMPGKTLQLSVTVKGTQTDKTVTWSISGNKKTGTTISQSGLLTVDIEETAASVTVKAVSNRDPSKSGSVKVTVKPLAEVRTVALSYNGSGINLSVGQTEGSVQERIRKNVTTTTKGITIDTNNCFLLYDNTTSWYGIGSGSSAVSSSRRYAIQYRLELKEGYKWPDEVASLSNDITSEKCTAFSVSVNGSVRKDAVLRSNASQRALMVSVPIPLASYDLAAASVSGLADQKYTGKAIKPVPVVKIGTKTLKNGTDYVLSYKNNIEVGTATVIIAGKGSYAGSCVKTFRITPSAAVSSISLSPKTLELAAGKSKALTLAFTPSSGIDKTVTWTSSDPSLATVSANGTVTAKSMGRVTITAKTANGKQAKCEVRVLFSDVTNKNLAAYDAIYNLADCGIVKGYGSYFDINGKCTRAQFVLFLWRYAGKPAPKSTNLKFSDAAEIKKLAPDYTNAIAWGSEQGIVMGFTSGAKKGQFRPNDPCTRGQVVTFLWRYKKSPAAKSGAKTFPDVPKTHVYYKSIMWALSYGITTGFSDGTFRPDTNCTRGQCVTFLYRIK